MRSGAGFRDRPEHGQIEKARAGVYPAGAVPDISRERLRRFFVQIDGRYRIAKPIRDACVFARHNVLSDPPFSRMDLVSCRNMLIYLGGEVQQKVMPILHYALRPGGYLWLGSSETIGPYRDLFEWRTSATRSTRRGPCRASPPREACGQGADARRNRRPQAAGARARRPDRQKEVDRLLLARYAPPSVLVHGDLEILQYRGETAPPRARARAGEPQSAQDAREGLVLGVRSAVSAPKPKRSPCARRDSRSG